MPSIMSNQSLYDAFLGLIDLSTGTWKALLWAGYTPDKDHIYVSSITSGTNYEINAGNGNTNGYESGYSGSGRKTLTGLSWTKDDTNDWGKWTFDYLEWATLNAGTPGGLTIYKPNSTDANSKILVSIVFSAPLASNGQPYRYTPPTNGVFDHISA